MSRVRLHLPAGLWGARVELDSLQRRHLIDVLRQPSGAEVEVFDGEGGVCRGVLEQDADGWWLLLGPKTERAETGSVWLACALLKGRKLDEVIRMVTEIGVSGIAPFVAERSVSRPDVGRAAQRLERWRTIATQAARQANRTRIPEVAELQTFEQLLERPPVGTGVLLHERAQAPLTDVLTGLGGAARYVLVGPEGGFSPAEVTSAERSGLLVAGLGLPVLQAPTASVVAAAFACVYEGCSLDFHGAVE